MIKTTRNAAFAFITAATLATGSIHAQQLKTPAPSPLQTVKQAFALSDVTVEYSRPSAKGRVVFGDVVPFGKVWRTGANQSTKITFGEDVKIEGQDLKAGTYALYTIPNKEVWEIMFYKDLTLGGDVANYKQENEVLKVRVKPQTAASHVETFAIEFLDMKSNSCQIALVWEKTLVAINVKADIDGKIMKNIETVMNNDSRPYYSAANYYYENDKDLKQALTWIDKAVENNPKAYWIATLKAKIHLKMKDFKGATDAANKAMALAKEGGDDAYIKMNEKIIAEAKGK